MAAALAMTTALAMAAALAMATALAMADALDGGMVMTGRSRIGFVYIITNKNHTVLYTGMTNNIKRRILEHKNKVNKCFSSRYNVDKLVWFETQKSIIDAIHREKQIKAGSRKKKTDLIQSMNPEWRDLFEDLL